MLPILWLFFGVRLLILCHFFAGTLLFLCLFIAYPLVLLGDWLGSGLVFLCYLFAFSRLFPYLASKKRAWRRPINGKGFSI